MNRLRMANADYKRFLKILCVAGCDAMCQCLRMCYLDFSLCVCMWMDWFLDGYELNKKNIYKTHARCEGKIQNIVTFHIYICKYIYTTTTSNQPTNNNNNTSISIHPHDNDDVRNTESLCTNVYIRTMGPVGRWCIKSYITSACNIFVVIAHVLYSSNGGEL